MEYEFQELAIPVHGVHVGMFSGVAILEEDGGGQFYVRSITLDGEKRTATRTACGSIRHDRQKTSVRLNRHGYDGARTLSEHLYRAIETELYASRDVEEAWADHLDGIAADSDEYLPSSVIGRADLRARA